MDKLLQKALAKGVKDVKDLQLGVGYHDVSGVVRINGQVVVSADTEKKATNSLMSVDFLLLTLKAAGVTREAAMQAISSVAKEYLVDWKGTKEDKEKAKEARKEKLAEFDPDGKGQQVFDKFVEGLPKIPVKGAVKFEGHIEQIQVSELNEGLVWANKLVDVEKKEAV